MKFNESFFENLGKSAEVTALCTDAANKAKALMESTAPVDTGVYKNSFEVKVVERAKRNVALVINNDRKTLAIEARRGVMARAIQAVKRGR